MILPQQGTSVLICSFLIEETGKKKEKKSFKFKCSMFFFPINLFLHKCGRHVIMIVHRVSTHQRLMRLSCFLYNKKGQRFDSQPLQSTCQSVLGPDGVSMRPCVMERLYVRPALTLKGWLWFPLVWVVDETRRALCECSLFAVHTQHHCGRLAVSIYFFLLIYQETIWHASPEEDLEITNKWNAPTCWGHCVNGALF